MNNKIPKIIHYCWFGLNPIPEELLNYIESWKEILNDYEFILWNEENFDINSHNFVKEAYEMKRYAFVTDYVRLYALANYGGIYLDTDVEVIKSFNDYLNLSAFTGTEGSDYCVTGTMGAEKNHPWILSLLDYYTNLNFIQENGRENIITNTHIITEITKKLYNWIPNNEYQVLKDDLHIFPFDYFCAKKLSTGEVAVTSNTVTIHHYSGSWLTEKELRIREINKVIRNTFRKVFGDKFTNKTLGYYRKIRVKFKR